MMAFQTSLYSCPFCEGFVVDHPMELTRHMIKEHSIYFNTLINEKLEGIKSVPKPYQVQGWYTGEPESDREYIRKWDQYFDKIQSLATRTNQE